MAKQTSPNSIRDFNDDWSLDSRNNLPYPGSAVQTFIKNNLRQSAGAAWFNTANMTLYFFRNTEDRDAFAEDQTLTDLVISTTVLNFSSEMYRVALTNNNGTNTIQAATNQTDVSISVDFDVQKKAISDSSWTSTGSGAVVHAYIDAGAYGQYTEIPGVGGHLNAGENFSLNIREYLIAGSNRFKVTFVDEDDDNVVGSLVYNVTLSEMYIEMFNNTWYNAIIEGVSDNYKLGGFRIVGGLSKTLKLEIYSGSSMVLSFEQLLGTSSYVDTPYNYGISEGLDLSTLETGVYICKAYLVSGTLTSIPVSYNFMHVTAADKTTAQLVCVNTVAPTVYNYSDNSLCEYAIYNAGFSTGTPHILIQLWSGTTPTTKVDDDYADIQTGVKNTLEYTVEWLVESTINLNLYFNISMGLSSQTATIPIDNSATYPAESGAAFYMNATSRSNNDANKTSILNEAATPNTAIVASWERMAWVDGIDGWTTDENGRKALLVPAGSKCTIPYQVMTGENMTFEICYKVTNVSDYDENIITIADNPTLPGFRGIRIRPTHFTIHSGSDIDDSNDTTRGKAVMDEETVHLLITIQNSFNGNSGKNLVTAYVNGCKALQFPYDNGTIFENNADFIIGSSSADVYIYSCRVYRKVLGVISAEQNYINSLRTLIERETAAAAFNSVLNTGTHEISYDAVVNSPFNYNFFVIEMKDGATVPSMANGWSKETSGYSNLEMHYGEHPEWDWKIENVQTSGQGTTSMNYYRWNIRWRIDKSNDTKKVPVAYYDQPTTGLDGKKIFHILPATDSKTVNFDGPGNHPAVMRITAKINQASSMQGHKIGATKAYTDLHNAIGLENEAQAFADSNNLPEPTLAVYQYPAFGFEKKVTMGVETYEFIGLFTIGPDKGDKPTFGYNIDDSIKQNLITLEGTNHAPKLAVFQYPWNNEVEYRASNECLNIVTGNNSFDNAWEVSNCHDLDTDKATAQADVQAALEAEFKPAYDVVWNNSTLIFPIALNDATYGGATAAAVLANINAAADTFRGTQFNDRFKNSDMQFWIEGEYTLYFYDIVTGQYVADINLVTQNGTPVGTTLDEQNEWFKAQRRARFLSQAPNYWDIQDAAYHFAFCVIFGATDNFAKNTYPYKMKTLANGGRWKWRQDDLDTIFDTDNLGTDSKPYYIEFIDSQNGAVVFGGGNSIFWNLMYEVFWNDYGVNKGIESIGYDVVSAMATLGGGSNPFAGVVNFFKKYFWDVAQLYFPQSAYNVDANFKYELGWLSGVQADALSQSLGRHLEAERLWCTRRAIYVMSLFKAGPFRVYSDTSLGRITFRPISFVDPTVTPTLWMYPSLFFGEGSPEATSRTEAGDEHEFTGTYGTGGQTNFYFQASDYMESLGDWKDLQLASGYVANIPITGAKLREFKIGDSTESVTTNVPSLSFVNTKCLEEIEARNASSLIGSIDLSVCTRLLRAYFEGSGITQVVLPNGSKIVSLHLSDVTNAIVFQNLKFMSDLVMPEDVSVIQRLQVENCTYQDAFQMLKDCYGTDDAALRYIRLIWSGIDTVSASDVHMLANIASNKDKDDNPLPNSGEYRGINAQGNIEGNPVIEGTVQLQAGMYSTDLEPLAVIQTEDYPGGLKRALSSIFGTLYVIYNPNMLYINFADDEVRRIALANWGDGEGVTMSAAAAVTDIGNRFKQNPLIESFDELQYFTGLTYIYGTAQYTTYFGAFYNCTNLKSVVLPDTIREIRGQAFRYCSSLESINLPTGITKIENEAFQGTSAMHIDINLPNLTSISNTAFFGSGITRILSLGYITTVPGSNVAVSGGCFRNCSSLTSVVLPSTLTTIGEQAFRNCANLETINFPQSITSISPNAFQGNSKMQAEVILPNATSVSNSAFRGTKITKFVVGKITTLTGGTNSSDGVLRSCTSLTYVDLPDTLTLIHQNAMNGCSALTTLIVRATTPPGVSSASIPNNSGLKIYVPYSSDHSVLTAYQGATNWSNYASRIYELDENGEIPE